MNEILTKNILTKNIFEELDKCRDKLQCIQYNLKELLQIDKVLEAKCIVETEHFLVLKQLIPENEIWIAMRNLISSTVNKKQAEIQLIGEKLNEIGREDLFEEEE